MKFITLCFLLSPVLYFLAKIIPYISYSSFKKKALSLIFISLYPFAIIFSTIYIGHYYLLCNPSSIEKKSTFWKYAPLITVLLCLFPYRMYWPLLYLL